MLPVGFEDSHGRNSTGKYNFLHNDHGNKSHIVNTNKETEEKENKIIQLNLSRILNDVESTAHHKNNMLLQY